MPKSPRKKRMFMERRRMIFASAIRDAIDTAAQAEIKFNQGELALEAWVYSPAGLETLELAGIDASPEVFRRMKKLVAYGAHDDRPLTSREVMDALNHGLMPALVVSKYARAA